MRCRRWLSLALAVAAPAMCAAAALTPTEALAAADQGAISGVVRHKKTKQPVKAAVVISCTCLTSEIQLTTNDDGLYAANKLPAGRYHVEVLAGKSRVTKTFVMERGAKLRADFTIDPKNARVIDIHVKAKRRDTTVSTLFDMRQQEKIPGTTVDTDFTAVIERSPGAQRGAKGGIRFASNTIAENNYTVDGIGANNPSFGTVGSSIVQEFLEEIEVQESGYDPELGQASGGQIQLRRVSGTNKTRGVARFSYTPRLAKPRFILGTDNALRATETPDFVMEGVVQVSGPIIKDKLYASFGAVLNGGRASLVQQFYRRVDKDNSGGFADCPFENGAFDCVDGRNFIATEKFAEQKFKTGGAGAQLQLGLDWVVKRGHQLSVTGRVNPSFIRRTYRRAAGFDPAAFGTNPNAALGGGSNVANGVVNDHFGWDRSVNFSTVLNYNGRFAKDTLELDASLGYSQFAFTEAWRLDNPELRNTTSTQVSDNQGDNLFEALDRENKVELVPGVRVACNNRNADTPPGLRCPVRQWLSGGLGESFTDRARVAEGRLSLTHFFNAAGSHQLKYGTFLQHTSRSLTQRYSGGNEDDFYQNCAERGLQGEGEYCYDPTTDSYSIENALRVNNHRTIFASADNPENKFTLGYGRVRKEQGELRAITNGLGHGIRADNYSETTSTQNYAVYLQDRWQVLSNLYLSGGVRWEMQDMRDINGERALFIWDNVAPRIGLVYDWTDEGKSRLFASYGWFYQPMPLQLGSRTFGGLVRVQRSFQDSRCRGQAIEVGGEQKRLEIDGQPTEFCADGHESTTGVLPGAVVPNLKGQYDQQFQLGYAHEVVEDLWLHVRWLHKDLGRAIEDVSTNGGSFFLLANPGVGVSESDLASERSRCNDLDSELQALPADDPAVGDIARDLQRCQFQLDAFESVGKIFDKPKRNFDSLTVQIEKRFGDNWMFNAAYTYSRLIGNYDGFVNPITGAVNVGASNQYDLPELVRNSFGPLAFNVPHRLQVDGFYTFDLQEAGRLTLGASFRYNSGFPISLRAGNAQYPGAYPVNIIPRGSGGRIESNYELGAGLNYGYPLPGDLELEVGARLINVTNAKAVMRVDSIYTLQDARPIAGGDISDLKHAKVIGNGGAFFGRDIISPQGNYGTETAFQTPLAARFDVILRF